MLKYHTHLSQLLPPPTKKLQLVPNVQPAALLPRTSIHTEILCLEAADMYRKGNGVFYYHVFYQMSLAWGVYSRNAPSTAVVTNCSSTQMP